MAGALIYPPLPRTADLFVDFEAGSDGDAVTAALMNAGSHGGTWTLANAGHMWIAAAASQAVKGGFSVGGTIYSGATGTRGFKFDPEGVTTLGRVLHNIWEPYPTSVSFGVAYSTTSTTLNPLSIGVMINAAGDYVATHWTTQAGGPALHLKTGDTGNIPISPNVWYWVTGVYRQGGTNELSVYLLSDGSLVGHTSVAAIGTYVTSIAVGRYGADAVAGVGQWYLDNVVVSLTGTFPLIPAVWG